MSPRTPLKRRTVLAAAATLMPSTAWLKTRGNPMNAVPVEERSLSDLQIELRTGRITARQVTAAYLARIERIDRAGPHLRSVIETNPDAPAIARSLDLGRRARGPLHGLPILIKDNIDTHDKMQTTAGSLALIGSKPPTDAFVVQQLRAAGAVILGKTNLSEWANIRSSQSTSGWSARGGLTRNPHALDRNTSGSSSGSAAAVAASLCAAAVGSETDGSILSPSSVCGIVGLKPTVGLISRSGVIPIAHSQDTLGPMARSVRDCAILLGAMTGFDADDAAMQGSAPHSLTDYTGALDANALKGARLGVARQFFGFHDQTEQAYAPVLEALKRAGAVLVDPVTLPAIETIGEAELTVLLYELKADLAVYLKRLGPDAPVKSLADVIAFNQKNASREMAWFGQDLFEKAQAKGPLTDPEYLDARAKCLRIARTEGIEAVMREHQLDALIAPTGGPAWRIDTVIGDHFVGSSTTPAAVAGTPAITVPAAMLRGLPLGLTFFGNAWSEAKLLGLAYAFEQTTKARRAPSYAKSVDA